MGKPRRSPASRAARLRDLIAAFLPDWLRLTEPEAAENLDLSAVDFLPLAPDVSSPRAAAAVRSRSGERVTVVVQIAAEAEPGSERRLLQTLRALGVTVGEPLLPSVVYLRGGRPGINLESIRSAPRGRFDAVHIYYVAFGLEGSRAEYYLGRPEPLSWALSALMRPSRRDHRRLCQERIGASALDADGRDFLLACVEEFSDDRGQCYLSVSPRSTG